MDKRDQTIPDLLVIGAGASGMTAAIAFQNKLLSEGKPLGRVVILEKNERVGKKVLATGNGRCNLSNKDMSLSHFHSHSSDFPGKVLSLVTPLDCLVFLETRCRLCCCHQRSMRKTIRRMRTRMLIGMRIYPVRISLQPG